MKNTGILLIGVGILFIALIVVQFYSDTEDVNTHDHGNAEKTMAVEHWMHIITDKGAEGAYQEYKDAVEEADLGIQHSLGHVFGEALYQSVGTSGFNICDVEIDGGCIHQFFGAHVAEHGIDGVDTLLTECQPGSLKEVHCLHSLGHVFVTHFGYDRDSLVTALTECNRYETAHENCYDGAFMEYDHRLLQDHNIMTARELDINDPYDPCDKISEQYADACYYRITRVWNLNSTANKITKKYQEMGALCLAIPDYNQIPNCAHSLGAVMDYDNITDKETAHNLCSEAFTDELLNRECHEGYERVTSRLTMKAGAFQ